MNGMSTNPRNQIRVELPEYEHPPPWVPHTEVNMYLIQSKKSALGLFKINYFVKGMQLREPKVLSTGKLQWLGCRFMHSKSVTGSGPR